nr:immunoglobulin light chain junction region [Macaca mulatta]MOV94332.1 immunoglobulin light chain junction region [Macaca mulatta]MOV94620.1 immunoglobulin light chain junction region [Macaca mulatta]MOV94761.1 immunoglobulin light chain junction region [Macaca mulatta]MOV95141.1 immunoglobulin light chain junction region [Macaca mulatta]
DYYCQMWDITTDYPLF